MSDWEGRLKAVARLAQPPVYQDGEIVCLNPTCRNTKLNRADRNCWRCGLDRFAPGSDEMRHALRFNYVPPPRLTDEPTVPPQAHSNLWTVQVGNNKTDLTFPAGMSKADQQAAAASVARAMVDAEAQREAVEHAAKSGLPLGFVPGWDDPPKRGLMDKLRAIANWKVPL